jgi:hypothetical protein
MNQAKVMSEPADPMFSRPYMDIDEWRDQPVRYRYVHGGFEGTDTLCWPKNHIRPKNSESRRVTPLGY